MKQREETRYKKTRNKRQWHYTALVCAMLLINIASIYGSDHVMEATKARSTQSLPDTLRLSLADAQEYAVRQNRSLYNASLAVQAAYAQRWQTIAAMLPSADAGYSYTNYCGYSAQMNTAMGSFTVNMPNVGAWTVTAAVGINGQGIAGALLNNVAIDMQKINLDKSENELRNSIMSSYMSVLALQSISALLDSSLMNMEQLQRMTLSAVEAGVAEQTTADQIEVRKNALKNSINSQKRTTALAISSLKVQLDVPVGTEIVLTENIDSLLSGESVLSLLSSNFDIHHNLNYILLEKQVELAKRNVQMAGWAYGPTVSLAYNYTKQSYYGDGGMRMTPPNLVQVSVKMPLWSSGKRAAGVVEKKIALEEAQNTLSETGDQLGIQYQQLRYNLSNAYETYMNERDNIIVSKRVFHSASEKFRYGTGSNMELTNASNDMISAQSSYIQAMLTLVNAQVELNKFMNK